MSAPSPVPTDGYIDLLQIDRGTIDGDSNVYVAARSMKRMETTASAGLRRTDIARLERTADAVLRRQDA